MLGTAAGKEASGNSQPVSDPEMSCEACRVRFTVLKRKVAQRWHLVCLLWIFPVMSSEFWTYIAVSIAVSCFSFIGIMELRWNICARIVGIFCSFFFCRKIVQSVLVNIVATAHPRSKQATPEDATDVKFSFLETLIVKIFRITRLLVQMLSNTTFFKVFTDAVRVTPYTMFQAKELRQFLVKRRVPLDSCREKNDLIDVLMQYSNNAQYRMELEANQRRVQALQVSVSICKRCAKQSLKHNKRRTKSYYICTGPEYDHIARVRSCMIS